MLDALAVGSGIDDRESAGLTARALEVVVPHALEELAAFLLEAIAHAGLRIPRRRARPADLDRRIEQQRQIRAQLGLHKELEVRYLFATNSTAATLIRV